MNFISAIIIESAFTSRSEDRRAQEQEERIRALWSVERLQEALQDRRRRPAGFIENRVLLRDFLDVTEQAGLVKDVERIEQAMRVDNLVGFFEIFDADGHGVDLDDLCEEITSVIEWSTPAEFVQTKARIRALLKVATRVEAGLQRLSKHASELGENLARQTAPPALDRQGSGSEIGEAGGLLRQWGSSSGVAAAAVGILRQWSGDTADGGPNFNDPLGSKQPTDASAKALVEERTRTLRAYFKDENYQLQLQIWQLHYRAKAAEEASSTKSTSGIEPAAGQQRHSSLFVDPAAAEELSNGGASSGGIEVCAEELQLNQVTLLKGRRGLTDLERRARGNRTPHEVVRMASRNEARRKEAERRRQQELHLSSRVSEEPTRPRPADPAKDKWLALRWRVVDLLKSTKFDAAVGMAILSSSCSL